MSKWQIVLNGIGRGKVCKNFTVYAPTLPQAEARALRICKRYLTSRVVDIFDEGDLTYTLYAGGRNVGKVKIKTA